MPIRPVTLAAALSVALAAGGLAGNAAVSDMRGLSDGYALPDIGAESAALASFAAETPAAEAAAEPVMLAAYQYPMLEAAPEPAEADDAPAVAGEPEPRIDYVDAYADEVVED